MNNLAKSEDQAAQIMGESEIGVSHDLDLLYAKGKISSRAIKIVAARESRYWLDRFAVARVLYFFFDAITWHGMGSSSCPPSPTHRG